MVPGNMAEVCSDPVRLRIPRPPGPLPHENKVGRSSATERRAQETNVLNIVTG